MIEKVLFDLGNVLLKFDFDHTHRKLAAHGAELDALESQEMIDLKLHYESGKITNSAFLQAVRELSGFSGSDAVFTQAWQHIFEVNAPMVAILAQMKDSGLPCYLLSNSNDLHAQHIRSTYDILDHFDDVIFSQEAQVMKPDLEIYEMAIRRFGLDPSQTLYIDDAAENIAAGRHLGFQCLHYQPQHHAQAATELVRLGLPSIT